MKFKNNSDILLFSLILITGLFFANSISAQTSTSTQSLISELQKQIQQLQAQVAELKTQLETSKKEIIEIKAELKISRSLKLGVTGDDVRELQEFLKQFPDIYPQGLVTGYFGPLTESAVRKFQEKNNIESIGVVGPKTLSKLNELVTEGAGKSEVIPPGLLIAPGLQNRLATTITPITPITSATTTPSIATSTPSTATTTPSGTIPATPATPATSATPISSSNVPTVSATPATPAVPASTTTSTMDTTPPTISNIQVANITETSATITWTTDELSSTEIKYSLTSPASATTTITAAGNVTSHSMNLVSLASGSTYYYVVISKDSSGNTATSNEQTFITLSPPPPPPTFSHTCGASISVPQDVSTVKGAVNGACEGDTIYISAGNYQESSIVVKKSGITLRGASGTKPENVVIDGGGVSGSVIQTSDVTSFTIDGITLRNGSIGLWLYGSEVWGSSGWENKGTFVVKNLIVKNNSSGIVARTLYSITLDHNLIFNNTSIAVDVNAGPNKIGPVYLTNNTIANNGGDGYSGFLRTGPHTLRNNIIVSNSGYGVHLVSYDTAPQTITYNDVWSNSVGYYKGYTGEGASFTPSPGTGELSVDPLFVGGSDYHLQSTSPVINAGDPSFTDSDGSRSDMGVYHGTPPPSPPPPPSSSTTTLNLGTRNLATISQMLNSLDEIIKQLSKILK